MEKDMRARIARARQYAADILAICGALEACHALEEMKQERLKPGPKSKGEFDRTKYQRDYMRAYMAKRRRGPKVEVK